MEENNTNIQEEQNVEVEGKESKQEKQDIQIDYEKLSNMITKGQEVKENGILKSFFESQGLKEDEIKDAIAEYKSNKQKKAAESQNNYNELNDKYNKMVETLKTERMNAALKDIGYELGLDAKGIKAVAKLSDINKDEVFNEDGTIDINKIKESIAATLEEYPNFKQTKEKPQFVKTETPDSNIEIDEQERLRKLFGLK